MKNEVPAELKQKTLFRAGDMGYKTFRIPAIACTTKGALLAACSARKDYSDWADIDLVMRRSEDCGETWSEPQMLVGEDLEDTVDNSSFVVDRETGGIFLFHQIDYAKLLYCRSDDDGRTFGDAVDVTDILEIYKKDYPWVVVAPGPGHGIQLRSGRLVLALWMSDGTGPSGDKGRAAHRPSEVFTIFSDDHGKTWEPGDVVARTTPEFKYPSESSLVELEDGRVMINMRSESAPYRRLMSISPDGATGWSKPEFVEEQFEPVCFGAICRLPGEKGQLVFINPDSRENEKIGWELHNARIRENLTAYVSLDDGKTWPIRKVIDPGVAGYADVIDGPDGALYCLYEHGGEMAYNDRLSVVKLTREWLLGE